MKIIFKIILLLFINCIAYPEDTQPPVLEDFSFYPSTIDVSNSDVNVTITLHITDNFSGCHDNLVKFKSPGGLNRNGFAYLVSGDSLDGIYEGTVTIPQYSEPGEWKVNLIFLNDNLNNFTYYYTSDLENLNFPTILSVTSTIYDITAPVLEDFSFYPSTIDVSNSDVNVTITLHITDNFSGCHDNLVKFKSPGGLNRNGFAYLVSGDSLDGIYEGTVTIPQYSEPGEWKVNLIFLNDNLNNFTYYYTFDLENLDFPTVLNVVMGSNYIGDTDHLPGVFEIKQNYPNPFNPLTKINYTIPKRTFVTLKIYDLLGNLIESLVNEEKSTGKYEIIFNGSNLPSGIYFYQMQSGKFISTKKLILLK